MTGRARRIWIAIALLAGVAVVVAVAAAVVIFSRYIHTDHDVTVESAAREFESARARFNGRTPLIEYRGFEPPVVHRRPTAPRQPLTAVHIIVYSADDAELRRADLPIGIVRAMTAGGRLRLANLGLIGDDRDLITLGDLERHGPGLVVDVSGEEIGPLMATDTWLGRNARQSRLLCWTD